MLGVVVTSATDSRATWSGFLSFCRLSMRAAIASLGLMLDERRFGVAAGAGAGAGWGGVD